MVKRKYWAVVVLAGIGAILLLSRNYRIVKLDSAPAGPVRETGSSIRPTGDLTGGPNAGTLVPESPRHAADEIERHRQSRLAALAQSVRDQEQKVEERRKVLATIVRTKGIIYKGQDSFYGNSPGGEDATARTALETYNQLDRDKIQLESQVNSLTKYNDQQLMNYAAGLDLPDNTVKDLYPQYLEAKRGLDDIKRQGLGERHPTRVAKNEQLQAMELQLNESVVRLRATMQAHLEMATDSLKGAGVVKEDARQEAIKRGLDAQAYVDAKRDFETDQQLLQEMKLKQLSEQMKDETGK